MTSPLAGGGMAGAGGGASQYASPIGLDRLVRKEVSLGTIRERTWPEDHIGLRTIAPFMDVESDDVIFDYIKGGLQDGLSPARAEDAEAELSQKDELTYGSGRAAIIDWSLKDKYTASDVQRYRDSLILQRLVQGAEQGLNLNSPARTIDDFQARLARHDALRRRKLDNRFEWLIMQAIETGGIAYNDGRIKFTVSYGRPAGQHNQAIHQRNTVQATGTAGAWNTGTAHDPIGDIISIRQYMYDTYGVWLTRAITSQKNLNYMWASSRFVAAASGVVVGGTPSSPIDVRYLAPGFDQQAAIAAVERATGVTFQVYDSVYWTRPVGSTTRTMNRFTTESKIFFMPSEGDLGEIDDTDIGFAKTLTSPHPEGNWSSGYYEWEQEQRDPWMNIRGSGCKAFPVFPYMEYTYTADVTAAKI